MAHVVDFAAPCQIQTVTFSSCVSSKLKNTIGTVNEKRINFAKSLKNRKKRFYTRMGWFLKRNAIKVYRKSAILTLFLHLCFASHNVCLLLISSRQMKIQHSNWTKKGTEYL